MPIQISKLSRHNILQPWLGPRVFQKFRCSHDLAYKLQRPSARPSSKGYEEGSGIVVRDFEQIRRNYLLGAFSVGLGYL